MSVNCLIWNESRNWLRKTENRVLRVFVFLFFVFCFLQGEVGMGGVPWRRGVDLMVSDFIDRVISDKI